MNTETTPLPKLTFFTKVKMVITAGFLLCIGFMTSIFVLTLSVIMLPFAITKIEAFQKQFAENIQTKEESFQTQEESPQTQEGSLAS